MYNKLHHYLSNYQNKSFDWGGRNCCTFASEWIRYLTDEDVMEDLNKKYHDKRSALKLMQEVGGIMKATENLLKGKELKIGAAILGDIVCGDAGKGDTMGICCGIKSVFLTESGLIYLRTSKMKKAWRILKCHKLS